MGSRQDGKYTDVNSSNPFKREKARKAISDMVDDKSFYYRFNPNGNAISLYFKDKENGYGELVMNMPLDNILEVKTLEGEDFRKEEFQPKLSFGDSVKGFAKSSWQDAITNSSVRAFKKWMYQDDGEEGGRVITKDEANIYFPKAKPWSDEVPLTLARHEHENYIRQEDAKYFSEISLQNGSNILAAVIGSGIGYMTDPAELSMAIGAGAITATGRSLFGVTRNMAPVARTLTRGTVYGAAENVPLEIPYYLVKGYNDEQYGLKDTAMNLAFGGSMGLAMSGLRVKLGDLDMPVELNAKTIQNSYINKLINSDEVSSAKILAEDMNFIRETYKDAIDAIVDDMANKAGIIPTPSQNKILRAKAERLVYQKINNT